MAKSPITEHHSPLPPELLLRELAQATVSFDEMFQLRQPGSGYVNLMKESFTGDKTIMARIVGSEARLMPIGMWPVKGRSAVANCGYLSCRVDANDSGSVVRSSFSLAVIYRIAIPGFLVLAVLMLLAIAALVWLAEGLDGRWMMVRGSDVFRFSVDRISTLDSARGKTQERLTREFLSGFIAEHS